MLRRCGRGSGFVAAGLLVALGAGGCVVVSEVTHTRNGQTVTESANEVPNSDDIDPCGLDESLLLDLSVDPADLSRGSGSAPTCTWEAGPYSETSLYYWVEGETSADPGNEVKVLDNGLTVEVFYESPGMTRYILRTEDLTINVNYSAPETLEPTAPEGVQAVIEQLVALYGVTP